MKHDLKVDIIYFTSLRKGVKNFEIRFNDRNFLVGDTLRLREWSKFYGYTGHELIKTVEYIYNGKGVVDGYIILGIQ